MAELAVSNTFVANTVITASGHNENFSDIVTWINDRYNGTDTWDFMKVSSTNTNPVNITSNASTTIVSIDNTATTGDPQINFQLGGSNQYSMGVDDSDSDAFVICNSGVLGTSNLLKITQGALSAISSLSTWTQTTSNSSATNIFKLENSSNTASSDARLTLAVGGSSGGDPYVFFDGTGTDWSFGVDNSDGNRVKLSNATGIGTNDVISVSATAFDPVGAATVSSGTSTNYWNDISYKTLTDRGCLPWCDDGVELVDGRRVSDLEALCSIQKHPTELTVHGLPKLDYKTFPKKSYRPADKDGLPLERDSNDQPVGGADGVEMTMLFGVMIGAFKQIKQELDLLKNK